MTLTFNLQQAIVMTHTQAKHKGQREVGSKERVETNGQTDGHDQLQYLPH